MPLLKPEQFEALSAETGFMLYLRDRPMLNYHFSKMGEAGWKAMAEPDENTPPNPYIKRAMAEHLSAYNLPEFANRTVPKRAAREFLKALKKKRVPSWVLAIAPYQEIQEVGGEDKK
ncbi:hypothetical protein DKM44_12805 [Deinococcus irradiatisoli]|uniref:Uncharacterized protein n=1 Tax=Deinococcus irradiatisoli TaxID=2202254 RepID=A0A2Z3JK88_9DEIO|nr:hypothetical protein [Deinococcus irradiatisoli]AWN24001.1 hypothetical protein DKM44_12805 [Deinococcus irradiatisoli]